MNFSIIIPTRNRAKNLTKLLDQLCKLKYPKNKYEIIVVNNSSDDNTKSVLQSYIKKYANIKSLNEKRVGPSFARNKAIKIAKYEKLNFLDDDCLIKSNYLLNYKRAWQKFPTSKIIGGPIHVKKETGKLTAKEQKTIKKNGWCFGVLDFYVSHNLYLDEFLLSSNFSVDNSSKSNSLFDDRLGREFYGKKVLFAEDFELCSRVVLSGETVTYLQNLEVQHVVSQHRFSEVFLNQRYWQAGIERYILDKILKEKFPSYKNSYSNQLKRELKYFYRPPFYFFKDLLKFKHHFIFTLSYYFNGRYFYNR